MVGSSGDGGGRAPKPLEVVEETISPGSPVVISMRGYAD